MLGIEAGTDHAVDDEKVFQGFTNDIHSDTNRKVQIIFDEVVLARWVRLNPKSHKNYIAMRAGVLVPSDSVKPWKILSLPNSLKGGTF